MTSSLSEGYWKCPIHRLETHVLSVGVSLSFALFPFVGRRKWICIENRPPIDIKHRIVIDQINTSNAHSVVTTIRMSFTHTAWTIFRNINKCSRQSTQTTKATSIEKNIGFVVLVVKETETAKNKNYRKTYGRIEYFKLVHYSGVKLIWWPLRSGNECMHKQCSLFRFKLYSKMAVRTTIECFCYHNEYELNSRMNLAFYSLLCSDGVWKKNGHEPFFRQNNK